MDIITAFITQERLARVRRNSKRLVAACDCATGVTGARATKRIEWKEPQRKRQKGRRNKDSVFERVFEGDEEQS